MSKKAPQTEAAVAFFGEMTASLTHEIHNILATIQESSGLMTDILSISPLSDNRFADRFDHSLMVINRQIRRGMELTAHFNRLAHTPDQSFADIILADTIGQICALSDRLARTRQVGLDCGDMDNSIQLVTQPLALYMVLFYGIMCCLAVLPAKSRIILTCRRLEGMPAVGFHCSGDLPTPAGFFGGLQTSDDWGTLCQTLDQVKAEIVEDKASCGFRMVFAQK